jgi:hypothetical protein
MRTAPPPLGRHGARVQLCMRAAAILALTIAHATLAHADGGLVRNSATQAGLVVTLFTSPTPLRAGLADVSVLVQDATTGDTVLDAQATLRIEPEHEGAMPETIRLTRAAATNKLLQAATVRLPVPGRVRLIAEARRGAARAAVVATVTVAPPRPPLLALWPYLALPPLVVAIFVVHQILRRRASRTTRAALAVARPGGSA